MATPGKGDVAAAFGDGNAGAAEAAGRSGQSSGSLTRWELSRISVYAASLETSSGFAENYSPAPTSELARALSTRKVEWVSGYDRRVTGRLLGRRD